MPLGAKVEAISLKASSSRQRGGKVRKIYSDGIDNIRSRTPCWRRFPRTAGRRVAGSPYLRSDDFFSVVENPFYRNYKEYCRYCYCPPLDSFGNYLFFSLAVQASGFVLRSLIPKELLPFEQKCSSTELRCARRAFKGASGRKTRR
jgi:hypothetical protein